MKELILEYIKERIYDLNAYYGERDPSMALRELELLSICQEFVKINEQFLFDSSSRRILRIEPKLWCKLQDAISKALGKEIIDF